MGGQNHSQRLQAGRALEVGKLLDVCGSIQGSGNSQQLEGWGQSTCTSNPWPSREVPHVPSVTPALRPAAGFAEQPPAQMEPAASAFWPQFAKKKKQARNRGQVRGRLCVRGDSSGAPEKALGCWVCSQPGTGSPLNYHPLALHQSSGQLLLGRLRLVAFPSPPPRPVRTCTHQQHRKRAVGPQAGSVGPGLRCV